MESVKIEINQNNAKQFLIDESFQRPVLVDFWADWCSPCKTLMPMLEKLADEHAGAFLLAKVNVDAEPMIASQFGIQSMPTVVLMKDGQPVDGFVGAKPEKEIRALLEKYLPKPWEGLRDQGAAQLHAGNNRQAIALLSQAWHESGQRAEIACLLASAYVNENRLDEAAELLKNIRLADQDSVYEQVKAQLELAQNAEKAPEVTALEARHKAQPDDPDIAFQLAVQYSQHNYQREALDILLTVLRKDLNARDGEVRRTFTDILAVLGKGDALAAEYQRKLYSLIY